MTVPFGPIQCDFPDAAHLFFSENIPPLVYYSHFLVLVVTALVAFFVLLSGKKELPNRVLFSTLFFFFIWVFLDSIFWASNSSDVIMFVWSLQILFEPLVHLGVLYLLYVLVAKKDVSFQKKFLFLIFYAPVLFLAGTVYSLPGFDRVSCLSIEGPLAIYYTYALELFYVLALLIFSLREYAHANTNNQKKQIILLSIGMVFFLLAFSWGNIVSSFTENWNFAQIGLFAVPVFIGFLGYSIVRYQTFNIKLAGSILLVGALWVAELALIFLQQSTVSRNVTIITFLFTTILGIFLIRSVNNEVRRREEITHLADSLDRTNNRLKTANDKLKELDELKTEFLSIASHQLRTPLSIIKGYTSLLEEGAYGKMTEKALPILHNIDTSNERLIKLVDEFLNVSRIEQGRIQYRMAAFAPAIIAQSVIAELSEKARGKETALVFENLAQKMPTVQGDEEKIRHAMYNFVDNAIKYTDKGKAVRITLREAKHGVQFEVVDQGVGLDEKDIQNLFQKFYRSPHVMRDFQGTGLGLFVVREFIEGHGGRVWAKSAGVGKGSEFGFWVPRAQKRLA